MIIPYITSELFFTAETAKLAEIIFVFLCGLSVLSGESFSGLYGGASGSSRNVVFGIGIGKEDGIPPVRIRCMTDRRWKEVREIWRILGGTPQNTRREFS